MITSSSKVRTQITVNPSPAAKNKNIQISGVQFKEVDNEKEHKGDCGLNAIISATGGKEISRTDIVQIIEAHHTLNSAAESGRYNRELIVLSYSVINGGVYANFRENVINCLDALINANQSRLKELTTSLNKKPLDESKKEQIHSEITHSVNFNNEVWGLIRNIRNASSFDGVSDKDYQQLLSFCPTFGIATNSVFIDHDTNSIAAYKTKLTQSKSWLTSSEVLAGMMANGYLCISQKVDAPNGKVLFEFKNPNAKQNVYLCCTGTNENILELFGDSGATSGNHWVHVIPEESLFANPNSINNLIVIEDDDGIEDKKRQRETNNSAESRPSKVIHGNRIAFNHPADRLTIDSLDSRLKLRLANADFSNIVDLKSIFNHKIINKYFVQFETICQDGSLASFIKYYMNTLKFSVDDIRALLKNVEPSDISSIINILGNQDNINKIKKIKIELNLNSSELVRMLNFKKAKTASNKIQDLLDNIDKIVVLKEHYTINNLIFILSDLDKNLTKTIIDLLNNCKSKTI